jgi:uncharacterized protein YndB with AHSA1/START domain
VSIDPHSHSHVEFNIVRIFDAPRQEVWNAWTDPALLAQWFGPKGSTAEVLRFDPRPAGVAHLHLGTADGHRMWAKFVYHEIAAPSRLVYVHSFADAEANVAPSPFGGPWPLEMLTTITFEEDGGRTTLSLVWVPIEATGEECQAFVANLESMQMGWTGSFDQLDALLARNAD